MVLPFKLSLRWNLTNWNSSTENLRVLQISEKQVAVSLKTGSNFYTYFFFLPADHQNVIIQERFWESSTYSTRMISLLFQLLTVSIPLYLLLFTEQKEDC